MKKRAHEHEGEKKCGEGVTIEKEKESLQRHLSSPPHPEKKKKKMMKFRNTDTKPPYPTAFVCNDGVKLL